MPKNAFATGLYTETRHPPATSKVNIYGLTPKVLALNAGEKVVRFLPPLNIGEEQVQEACAIIRKACAELAAASL